MYLLIGIAHDLFLQHTSSPFSTFLVSSVPSDGTVNATDNPMPYTSDYRHKMDQNIAFLDVCRGNTTTNGCSKTPAARCIRVRSRYFQDSNYNSIG